jgi:hypothetical protein
MAQQVFSSDDAPRRKIAKVAMARRLAIRLYWMWRKGWDYEQVKKVGSQGRKLSFRTVLTKGSTR